MEKGVCLTEIWEISKLSKSGKVPRVHLAEHKVNSGTNQAKRAAKMEVTNDYIWPKFQAREHHVFHDTEYLLPRDGNSLSLNSLILITAPQVASIIVSINNGFLC